MKQYDLIVLGAGSAGLSLVHSAAGNGLNSAIVEKSHVSGTCVNVGCIPTKILISSAKIMQTVRDAGKFGVIVESPKADWTAMVARKDEMVERIRNRSYRKVKENERITLYEGEAVFLDAHTVEVNGEVLTAEKIVIATGARSAIPPVKGLKEIDFLTSTTAMELKELPKSLLILGGGIIALEFSQMLSRLGVKVTIIQHGSRLAPNLEPEISEEIRKVLASEGVSTIFNTNISSVFSEDDKVFLVDETENGPVRYHADRLLLAAGRAPNTDKLALEKVGIAMNERGYIIVDDNFQTGVEGIWAIGDVIGGMMFTHKARNDALLLARNMFKGKKIQSKDRLVPFSIFTEPEIAGIGLSEAAAISAGHKIKVQRFPFGFLGRAMAIEKTIGFVKLILEAESGKILGAHIIGPEAGELIHELIMAMHFGAKVHDLQDMIHVHPTLAETIFSASWSKK